MARLVTAFLTGLLLGSLAIPAQAQGPDEVHSQNGDMRRVNLPYFSDNIWWGESAVFWFGVPELKPDWTPPGRNYVDMRVGYNDEVLYLLVTVVDYFLWYNTSPQPFDDLTEYDAIALYLDMDHDRATSPQTDDYYFLSGWRSSPLGNAPQYQRQGRGDGGAWDLTWTGVWTDTSGANWSCNPGPNSNACGIDYGWMNSFEIPWSTLGLDGPPPPGTVWGMGIVLYDRDDAPPAGYVAPEAWPETLDTNNPLTWGEMAFAPPAYQPPPAAAGGTTVIRRGLGSSVVEDAWVGGGGDCSGGHEGGADNNYGDSTSLFVANQSVVADFPCFSKSFLRFYLDPIPPDKVIISATLTLHHWSNAEWTQAKRSLIQLFTVDPDWEEHTVTWNNAPLARQNLSATWVEVRTPDDVPLFPGDSYDWDATQAVAEAYALGQPLSIGLYTGAPHYHSSKYFTSSEAGDWNEVGRPTLTVLWGDLAPGLQKRVSNVAPIHNDVVTYTLSLRGVGTTLYLGDPLPGGVTYYPGSITPPATYDSGDNAIGWHGLLTDGQTITFTYAVVITAETPLYIENTAIVTDGVHADVTASAFLVANGYPAYLPLVLKSAT
jgi:hypothetical protein